MNVTAEKSNQLSLRSALNSAAPRGHQGSSRSNPSAEFLAGKQLIDPTSKLRLESGVHDRLVEAGVVLIYFVKLEEPGGLTEPIDFRPYIDTGHKPQM